jgi:DNA repair protein RecN (Recombination protein N)
VLRELHISNLAVIADAAIELGPRLNCFTGATGAGKSLVLGALEVLLGLRSPAEMLRPGADEGRVTGVFEIQAAQTRQQISQWADMALEQSAELMLTRRLHASGRTSVSLNGHPITLNMLRQIAELLVDVHGQHDHQFLLRPSNQLEVLDQFGKLEDQRRQYHQIYQSLQEARRRLEELTAGSALRRQQLELCRFQAEEIDRAEPRPGEYEELKARATVLSNLQRLKKEAGAVYAALYEADGSLLERLKMMSGVLGELLQLDHAIQAPTQAVREATIQLEEAAFDLSRYLDRLEMDPSELAEVEDRLNILNRLLSKYGPTVETVLEQRRQIEQQIQELSQAGEDLTSLQAQIEPLRQRLTEVGHALSAARRAAGKRLGPLVEQELAELGMDKARFTVDFKPWEPVDGLPAAASGFEQVEFVAQTNPGQLAQPLRKIASGGELSRSMLALKGILTEGDRVSVLVFDEIDANVGGRLGAVIGRKLRQLAQRQQVLCITHLPQIACYAQDHLRVSKHTEGHSTQSIVRRLEADQRIEELAEMIGGPRLTETTRQQARELLEAAAGDRARPAAKKATRAGAREKT